MLQWHYSFVNIGNEGIQQYMQYEISMTVFVGRIANQRKEPKWLQFENYTSEVLNI